MTTSDAPVAATLDGLADLLETDDRWDAPSLCAGWEVRHLVAHLAMPVRLTPEQFGQEMAAARGDFGVLSDTVAARDASLPPAELLAALRSPTLHAWEPPGGGADGALVHAVVHSLDVTEALGRPPVAPGDAVERVLDLLIGSDGAWFGVDLAGRRFVADDRAWSHGSGQEIAGSAGALVALLAGRTLPAGPTLPAGRSLPRRTG